MRWLMRPKSAIESRSRNASEPAREGGLVRRLLAEAGRQEGREAIRQPPGHGVLGLQSLLVRPGRSLQISQDRRQYSEGDEAERLARDPLPERAGRLPVHQRVEIKDGAQPAGSRGSTRSAAHRTAERRR